MHITPNDVVVRESITLLMEAVSPFDTSVNIYQTTWCYIPEDRHTHTHCLETLKKITCTLWQIFLIVPFRIDKLQQVLETLLDCCYFCIDNFMTTNNRAEMRTYVYHLHFMLLQIVSLNGTLSLDGTAQIWNLSRHSLCTTLRNS
jgi:hypothetical protein